MTAEMTVLPYAGGWIGACTVHGTMPGIWPAPYLAAWDVIGHATTHHTTRNPT